eukprot:m.60580 g.60580  ORF g.60580 m.60580 type:complete len:251 (+) comp11827_c0_seq1:59-811(+)
MAGIEEADLGLLTIEDETLFNQVEPDRGDDRSSTIVEMESSEYGFDEPTKMVTASITTDEVQSGDITNNSAQAAAAAAMSTDRAAEDPTDEEDAEDDVEMDGCSWVCVKAGFYWAGLGFLLFLAGVFLLSFITTAFVGFIASFVTAIVFVYCGTIGTAEDTYEYTSSRARRIHREEESEFVQCLCTAACSVICCAGYVMAMVTSFFSWCGGFLWEKTGFEGRSEWPFEWQERFFEAGEDKSQHYIVSVRR